jgi:hypothetical protein
MERLPSLVERLPRLMERLSPLERLPSFVEAVAIGDGWSPTFSEDPIVRSRTPAVGVGPWPI